MSIYSDFFCDFPLVSKIISCARGAASECQSILSLNNLVKDFAKSNELNLIFNKCLQGFEDLPGAQFPFMGQDHIIFCNDFNCISISIGRTEASSDFTPLYSSPNEVLLCAVSAGGFSYQKNEMSNNWNCDVYSPDILVDEPKFYHCNYGETVFVSTNDIFDYCSTGGLVLKIAMPPRNGLMWEFDRNERSAKRVFASALAATTYCYILKFLSEYGNEDSVVAVSQLRKHPFHYVRWEVAKALGQMDEFAFIETLKEFQEDLHPHVRRAAFNMLTKIGENYGN